MYDENNKPSCYIEKFLDECLHHSKIRHPNIVQLIGIHYSDPSYPVPTIVMEYLPMTLTQCLRKYPQLPTHMEGSILLDVASGLDFLHRQSPPIMHRDLTANNVLLTNYMQAKISDLGQAKVLNPFPARRQTTAPGTECYMPLEALTKRPVYNTKIDVFSFGVLILHVSTHEWPFREKSIDPITHQEKPATEVEQRKVHFDKMDKDSLLYQLASACLENDPEKRPNAAKLVKKIGEYCPDPPFANTLEMQLALNAESSKAQVLETHLQEVNIQIGTIAENCQNNSDSAVMGDGNDALLAEVSTKLHKVTLANTSVLASTDSADLIVKYKHPATKSYGKHSLLTLSSVQNPSTSVVTNMDICVRAPLSIHFTGTHIRTIDGIREPWGLAAGRQGIFVACAGYKGVLLYSRLGELCGDYVDTLYMYNRESTRGQCYYPRGIAIDHDNFILADTWCHRIQRFKLSSDLSEATIEKSAGTWGNGKNEFNVPIGVRVRKTNGDVYVCDKDNHRIQVLDQQLQFKSNFGKEGEEFNEFRYPMDIDFDSKGNIYVADCGHYAIKIFNENWEYQGEIGKEGCGKGTFHYLTSICIDKYDYLYATDKSWNCIQVFNPDQEFVMQIQLPTVSGGNWSSEPFGIAVDDEGFVYVSCKATGCVHVYK